MACNGNSSEICGGSYALSVYAVGTCASTTKAIITHTPTCYLGCFADDGATHFFDDYYFTSVRQ